MKTAHPLIWLIVVLLLSLSAVASVVQTLSIRDHSSIQRDGPQAGDPQ
jgi:hypothetical protein